MEINGQMEQNDNVVRSCTLNQPAFVDPVPRSKAKRRNSPRQTNITSVLSPSCALGLHILSRLVHSFNGIHTGGKTGGLRRRSQPG